MILVSTRRPGVMRPTFIVVLCDDDVAGVDDVNRVVGKPLIVG